MQASPSRITGRITMCERLQNSRNGNPRFGITIDGEGSWTTAADHSFAYTIGNRGFRVGDVVTITIGGRGTITGITSASGETGSAALAVLVSGSLVTLLLVVLPLLASVVTGMRAASGGAL